MVKHTIRANVDFDAEMAAKLVQKAGEFACNVSIVVNEKTANAKSIMGVLSLGSTLANSELTVVASGEGEDHAAAEVMRFFGVDYE